MSLEQELTREVRATALRKAILTSLRVAGVLTVAVMAPNVLSALGKVQRRPNERVKSAIQRLKEKGFVRIDSEGAHLTAKGERYLDLVGSIKVPIRWDGKWRIVIFDIPERRKLLRETLRHRLLTLGFTRLQNSVWIFPYDCEDLLVLLKADFKIGTEVQYIIADKIEGATKWRKHFGL